MIITQAESIIENWEKKGQMDAIDRGVGGIGKNVYILLIGIYLDEFVLVGNDRSRASSGPARM